MIDYYKIETELQAIVESKPSMTGVKVIVENEPVLSAQSPCLTISTTERVLDSGQALAAGSRVRWVLNIDLWLWLYGVELPTLIAQRNDLLSKLETLLLGPTRTINGTVETYWLEGGKFISASRPDNVGLVVGAQTIMKAVVTATT